MRVLLVLVVTLLVRVGGSALGRHLRVLGQPHNPNSPANYDREPDETYDNGSNNENNMYVERTDPPIPRSPLHQPPSQQGRVADGRPGSGQTSQYMVPQGIGSPSLFNSGQSGRVHPLAALFSGMGRRSGGKGMGNPLGGLSLGSPFGNKGRPSEGSPLGSLGSLLGGMGSPFGGMGSPFGGMGSPFGGMGSPFSGMGSPFGGMGSPFGGMGNLLGGMGSPFGGMGSPFGGMGNSLGGMGSSLGGNPLRSMLLGNPSRDQNTEQIPKRFEVGNLLNAIMSGNPVHNILSGLSNPGQSSSKPSGRPVSLKDILMAHGMSLGAENHKGEQGGPDPNGLSPRKDSKEDIARGIDSILGSVLSPIGSRSKSRRPSTTTATTMAVATTPTPTAPRTTAVHPTTRRPRRAHTMQGRLGSALDQLKKWKSALKNMKPSKSDSGSAQSGTGASLGTFRSKKASISYNGKNYRESGTSRTGTVRQGSEDDINLEADFKMNWDITHNGNRWWKGPNVCDRKESEDKEIDEGEIPQQTLQCSDDVHSFGCTKTTLEGSVKKVLKHVYECCDGWTRQKGDDGCPTKHTAQNHINTY